MNRLSRRMRQLSPALLILATTLLLAGAATADASASIEGVWSFNGGRIAVKPLSDGIYIGIVVAETQFASCPHPVGQQIWSDMKEQSDGSYHGLHQWYFANCEENPTLGKTAWRILTASDKSHYLRVCFSHPGEREPQPEISATGAPKEESEYAAHGVTYGCYNSALVAPLPETEEEAVTPTKGGTTGTKGGTTGTTETPGSGKGGLSPEIESLTLPSTHQCLRVKRFVIRLREPKYDPYKTVTITFRGHKVATSHKGEYIVATISLRKLTKGSFTIHINATTVLGHHLSARRTYHICHRKPKTGKKKG